MARMKHRFRISYYNPNGKLYYSTEAEWYNLSDELGAPVMHSAIAKLRGLRHSGGQQGMPGNIDAGWPGPILIESLAERDRPPSQLLMPTQTDLERFIEVLGALKINYETYSQQQRVATSFGGVAIAQNKVNIDAGLNHREIYGTFWFDERGKFLSHTLWEYVR